MLFFVRRLHFQWKSGEKAVKASFQTQKKKNPESGRFLVDNQVNEKTEEEQNSFWSRKHAWKGFGPFTSTFPSSTPSI